MRPILLWWRNLNAETKQTLMTERNIKAITFVQIKVIYKGNGK